jgi:hypothetical protein
MNGEHRNPIRMFVLCKTGYEKEVMKLCLLFGSRGKDAQVLVRLGCGPEWPLGDV